MKKSRLMISLMAVAMVATLGIGSTLAYFTDKEQASNVFEMGKVDITLTEPLFGQKTENTFKMSEVHPNQTIVKDPTVTVVKDSMDAYIRVKVDVTGFENIKINGQPANYAQALMDTFTVNGKKMSDAGWFYSTDGYFYYNKIVSANDVIKVFDQFKIPEKWGNETAGLTFNINVTAEAIQAADFTPKTDTNGNIIAWNYSDGTPVTPEAYVTK